MFGAGAGGSGGRGAHSKPSSDSYRSGDAAHTLFFSFLLCETETTTYRDELSGRVNRII